MRIENSNLNFHGTFVPQMNYVSKILILAAENYKGTINEISERTGIPSGESTGKVTPHICYARYMGLIDVRKPSSKYVLSLTKVGNLVYQEDPYLMEDMTRYLLHYMITDVEIGAPQWSFLFKGFDSALEEQYYIKDVEKKAQEYFAKKCSMKVVRLSYEKDCFNGLGVVETGTNKCFEFKNVIPRYEYIEVYAYTLLSSWEKYFNKTTELTIDQITNELKWNKPFGLDYESTLEMLDEMSVLSYVNINKQLKPITVIKLYESDEILTGIYNSLI